MTQAMKLYYEDELARALAEDGSASSTYITPKAYYQDIMAKYATGKYAKAISDRSGMGFHTKKWLENGMDHSFMYLSLNQSNHN